MWHVTPSRKWMACIKMIVDEMGLSDMNWIQTFGFHKMKGVA